MGFLDALNQVSKRYEVLSFTPRFSAVLVAEEYMKPFKRFHS
jgi:hypothetical protein